MLLVPSDAADIAVTYPELPSLRRLRGFVTDGYECSTDKEVVGFDTFGTVNLRPFLSAGGFRC
jgi:hypothetical protein